MRCLLPVLCLFLCLAASGCLGDLEWAHPTLFGGENNHATGTAPGDLTVTGNDGARARK